MSETTQQPVESQEEQGLELTFGQTLVQYDANEPREDLRNVKLFTGALADICYAASIDKDHMDAKILDNTINQIVLAEAVITMALSRIPEVKV